MKSVNKTVRQKRNLVIVECPTNLGVIKMPYAKEPGVKTTGLA